MTDTPLSLNIETSQLQGFGIVGAGRGLVWVGTVAAVGDYLTIAGARIVRRWGTSQGLAELAITGPLPETVLDAAHDVIVPRETVAFLYPSEPALWAA